MKQWITYLKFIVACVIFYLLITTNTVELKSIAHIQDHPGTLLIAALLLFSGLIIGAVRCTLLMHAAGIRIRTLTMVRLQIMGSMFSIILPGAAGGDAIRAAYLFRLLPSHRMTGLLVLGIDRLFALFGLVALTCLLLWANYSTLSSSPILLSYTVWATLVFAIGLVIGIITYSAARFLKIPILRISWLERLRPYVRQMRDAILVYREKWLTVASCFLLSLLGSFMVVMGIVFLASIFPFAPTAYVTALAGVIGNISSAIPLTPGGIGIGEAVFARICKDLMANVAPYATIYLVFRLIMALVSFPGLFIYIFFDIKANHVTSG